MTLKERAARGKLRFHMPGHKGRDVYGSGLLRAMELDFTELRGLVLYDGTARLRTRSGSRQRHGECRELSLRHAARPRNIRRDIYLSTRGKKKIIIDRGCHKAYTTAAALMGLNPVYVYPDRIEGFNINGAVSPIN